MLANDSSTVAVEIPIWLTEDEIAELETRYGIELAAGGAPRSITGHIDFLQVRNDAVHILDYKPDARTNKPIAQLAIYALALTIRVPGLKLFDIKCAWFNEEEYNEFFPRTLFAKRSKIKAPLNRGLVACQCSSASMIVITRQVFSGSAASSEWASNLRS